MAETNYVKFSTRILPSTKDKASALATSRKHKLGTKIETTHDAIIAAGVKVLCKQK